MSHARRLILAGLCLLCAANGTLRAQTPAPTTPTSQVAADERPRRVRLIIDEQLIRDATRKEAWTISAASVPKDAWRTVVIEQRTNLEAFLNKYYDLYTKGAGSNPRTLRLMADLIAKANPELVATDGSITSGPLKVPPIPMRAFSDYRLNDVKTRTFDPETMTYELTMAKGEIKTIDASQPPPVLGHSELRGGRYTELLVTLTDEVRALVRGTKAEIRALIALDDDPERPGMAELQMLGAQDPPCDSASAWLPSSPYHASIKFGDADLQKLERQAQLKPLTLIDFNFRDGHGAKVRAVVTETLERLGLKRLNDDAFIKKVELNPAANRAGLREMLAKYKAFLLGLVGNDQAPVFAPAEHWVETYTPPDDKAEKQEVPSLVLQAVFWTHFGRQQTLNFSFTTNSAALSVADSNFMANAKAFGAFAAGNNGLPAGINHKPQAEAMHYPVAVNVTHGRLNGKIDGDYTNDVNKVIVNLIAPGCGYDTMPITVADNGSSFASPYVATAAWIRMLQGLGANFIKRSLLSASLPLPEVGNRVESGGLFDPALLLAAPGAHLVTPDREFLPLTSLTLSLKYQKNDVETAEITGSLKASPTHLVTLHPCGANVCAIVRAFSKIGDVELTAGQVISISVHAVAGQRTFDEKDLASILTRIKTISF